MHPQVQEVGGARDARVVVADRVLAAVRQVVVRERDPALGHDPEVGLDARLVLRRRRHDLRVEDRAVGSQAVPVEEHAARRLRGPEALARPRRDRDGRCDTVGPAVDDPQRLLEGDDELDTATGVARSALSVQRASGPTT